MKINKQNIKYCCYKIYNHLYFWPLLIMAGRLVSRVVFNVWNMIEPGGN